VEQWEKLVIDFHCSDKCASFCKRKGERSETSANLEDVTVVVDIGETCNLSHRVGINNKVLSKRALRTKTCAF
jgi:hypothetical protein